MPQNPLVSVTISAYNHERYVEAVIRSIMAQTYQNIELLVIDDGSKDSTWAKIEGLRQECEKRFVRVYFETKENEGAGKTGAKLSALAQGKYLYMIASDDMAKPEAIEKEVSFLEEHPDYVLAVGDSEIIDKDSNRVGWDKEQNIIPLSKATYKSFGDLMRDNRRDLNPLSEDFGSYKSLVRGNYIPNGYCVRKSLLDKTVPCTSESPLEDWWMMLQISKYGKMKYFDEILFSYRWHDSNTAKRKEYMKEVTYKTQLCEKNLVNSLPDKKWKEIFDEEIVQIKSEINFFNILKYYRLKNMDVKQYIVEVFGHKFILKTKRLVSV